MTCGLAGRFPQSWTYAAGLLSIWFSGVSGLDNGLGLLPPMGYNSWNHLHCAGMSEVAIRAVADAMVSKGFKDAGYEYLILDDCWMASERDKQGRLQAHPQKFPSGMRALGEYIHSRGLKFGIYTDRGTRTCEWLPGSEGHEELDAQTFAEWGVDYVKEDNCWNGQWIGWMPDDKDKAFRQFSLFRDALNATGRPIFFAVCGAGGRMPVFAEMRYYATDPRGGGRLANSWRITADCTGWISCQAAFNTGAELHAYAGEGHYNDPDMLLGSTNSAAFSLSKKQSRTQFNILAILMAPLLFGAPVDLWDADNYDLQTYLNTEVVAVNQDSLLKPGYKAKDEQHLGLFRKQVWVRELSGGAFAMVFLNTYLWSKTVTCDELCWEFVPAPKGTKFAVRDLWSHAPAESDAAIAGRDYSVLVEGNGASKMFKLTPVEAQEIVPSVSFAVRPDRSQHFLIVD